MNNTQGRGRGKRKPEVLDAKIIETILLERIRQEQSKILEDNTAVVSQANAIKKTNKVNILSLFTGCGGLDTGFELAGMRGTETNEKAYKVLHDKSSYMERKRDGIFNVFYANDIFPEALATYERVHGAECIYDSTDIRKIKLFPTADIVLGGFPCPGFSAGGPRLIDDPRNFLYLHFIRCLEQSQPKIFVAENVKGMLTLGKGEVFRQIFQDFSAAGYAMYYKLLNAKDYGVPQSRERVVLVGVRKDLDFNYVYDAPVLNAQAKPLRNLEGTIRRFEDDPGPFYDGGFSPIFLSRNRKKSWDDVSFTIQASARQAPMWPGGEPMKKVHKDLWEFQGSDNRRLSVREAAAIQTFPDWYDFDIQDVMENKDKDKVYKQIGNAVPIMLGYHIARPLIKLFNEL